MKKTMGWLMAFAVVAVVPGAAHASTVLPYLQCATSDRGADEGTQVTLSDVYGPIHAGAPQQPYLIANVSETTIAGRQLLAQLDGVKETQASVPGAPKYFDAQNFELEVQVDANDTRGIPAHVTAETIQGARISEDVYCHFLR